MKKMLSVLLIMVLLMPALGNADCGCEACDACECETNAEPSVHANASVLIAKSETYIHSGVYTGLSWWALTEGNRAFGKISPVEDRPVCPASPPKNAYVGGCMDNGLVREKGSMAAMTGADGIVYGLTSLDVKITLKTDCVSLVESIVRERLGADEITANSIIAATMWWQETTVTHIFFHPSSPRMWVGVVAVNGGRNTIDLWAGDWDGDGLPELGFCAGSSPAPTPTPEPQATPAPRTETQRECTAQKTCIKNVYITNVVQINIASKATQVVNVGKPCMPKCLE